MSRTSPSLFVPERERLLKGFSREECMARKFLTGTMLICALTFGSGAAFAQSTTTSDEAKKAGKATKEAGKDIGEAAEHAGKATAKTAKKTGKVIKKAVTPDTTTALCKDGTVQKGKTKLTACDDHGGVQ